MKKLNKLSLNRKLLMVFFSAVFLLSSVNFFVQSWLISTMEQEEAVIRQQKSESAKVQLDAAFAEIHASYLEVAYDEVFRFAGESEPTAYQLWEMSYIAQEVYRYVPWIHQWFVVLRNNNQVISNNGNYDLEQYLSSFCRSDAYTVDYWVESLDQSFYRIFLPEAEFACRTTTGGITEKSLMPMVISSYYNSTFVTVLLLDMDAICTPENSYLGENLYMFSDKGKMLYSTEAVPVIDTVPVTVELSGNNGTDYRVQHWVLDNSIQCVKLLTENQSADIVRSSLTVSLLVAVGALVIITVLGAISVKTMLHPVNRMLDILRQHGADYPMGNIHSACEELEQILESREQQTVALAQRDAALSGYFLQSQMKNIYVDIAHPEEPVTGMAYIAYIQIHYREERKECFAMSWAELENCLLEMMSGALNELFDAAVVFQLEAGRFAAKVTLLEGGQGAAAKMERFMERLEQEKEFAWFTVVLSQVLSADTNLSDVYVQIQEAARLARVWDTSQLLVLPAQEPGDSGIRFSQQDEQVLFACVRSGKNQEAAEIARQLLEKNLQRGISHSQMATLCVAIVNAVSYAMTELTPSAEKIAAASGVYNALTSGCRTGSEYIRTVTEYICAANAPERARQEDQLLDGIRQYLEKNYSKEFSSEEMAGALWVSRSYLSSYYKSKTGMNLSESIQLFRIQKAVELLKDPDITIAEIGQMVGIPSSNTFLRHFRKYTGMTPKEYRLKNCNTE